MIKKKVDKSVIKKSENKSKLSFRKIFTKKFMYVSSIVILKLLLISLVIFGLYESNSSYANTVSLLAVSENSDGDIVSGSVIDLKLVTKPGSGNVFIKQGSLVEIDTQISITNSNKIACNLFKLDCDSYDFYYEFDSNSLVLKGPSASSAIAILTAKTVNREKIRTDDVVITGSLNSGGIIGVVGGVDKKIETAVKKGFDKVLVPAFSDFNKTKVYSDIKVIRSVDIIDAYNEFNGNKYSLELEKVESSEYQLLMKKLSDDMCARAYDINDSINYDLIKENSTEEMLIESSISSLNDSKIADLKGNYYSMGSYCYNANLNLKNTFENLQNLSLVNRDIKMVEFEKTVKSSLDLFESNEYKSNIRTLNDFYVYLILIDRTYEALEIIESANELKLNLSNFERFNESKNSTELVINDSVVLSLENNILLQKNRLHSYSVERFYTVSLWEKFISHTGPEIVFDELKVSDVCRKVNREISIKKELLLSYDIDVFEELINEQLEYDGIFKNKYLCIYKGLELDGRINTVLNSAGITSIEEKEFIDKFVELTTTRINLNSHGSFPFIPTIYSEYSGDLIAQGDVGSGLLYSNYAMSYSSLNLYLEDDSVKIEEVFELGFERLFDNLFFVVTILIVIAFMA
jgi:predicted S18 family serine protease